MSIQNGSTPVQTRVVYYPSSGRVYSQAELVEVFAAFSINDPIIEALRQVFQARFGSAALDAADPVLSERAAGHAAGRIQEIADFRDEILGYINAAGRVREKARAKR